MEKIIEKKISMKRKSKKNTFFIEFDITHEEEEKLKENIKKTEGALVTCINGSY